MKLALAAVQLCRSTRTLLTALHVSLLCRPVDEAVEIFLQLQRGEGVVVDGEQLCTRISVKRRVDDLYSSKAPDRDGVDANSTDRTREKRSDRGSDKGRMSLRDEYGDTSLSSVCDDLDRIISGCKVAKEIHSLQRLSSAPEGVTGSDCDVAVDLLLRQWVQEFVTANMWRYELDLPLQDGRDAMDQHCHHDLSEDFANAEETGEGRSGIGPSFLAVLCELCGLFFKLHVKSIVSSDTRNGVADGVVDGGWHGDECTPEAHEKMVNSKGNNVRMSTAVTNAVASTDALVHADDMEKANDSAVTITDPVQYDRDGDRADTEDMEGQCQQSLRVGSVPLMSNDADRSYELCCEEEGAVGMITVCEKLLSLMSHFLYVHAEVKRTVSEDVDISSLGSADDVLWIGDVAWNMVTLCFTLIASSKHSPGIYL